MKTISLLSIVFAVTVFTGCSQDSTDKQIEENVVQESAEVNETPVTEVGVDDNRDQNAKFDNYKERFLRQFWEFFPGYGIYVGYYDFDDKLIIPDGVTRELRRNFFVEQLDVLNSFDAVNLNVSNATDLEIIMGQVESYLWYIDEFRNYEWDPSNYNVAGAFGLILNTDYKPLKERLDVIGRRLENVPPYYEAAKANIKTPTLPHLGLAIQQSKGALGVFDKLIPEKLQTLTVIEEGSEPVKEGITKQELDSFNAKLIAASLAIGSYVEWLEERQAELLEGGAKDFRIGEELYEEKFTHDIVSSFSAKELYQIALQEKISLHREMTAISKELWPEYMADKAMPEDDLETVKLMIDHLSLRHIERENFVKEIRRQMPIIQKFMDDNKLLDSDPTRPLVVRETPAYQRGFSGASVDAPGPYDATANTYYNVTPLDDNSEEEAESWLREYNHWMLQILNIHEAIPGHYTQLMHANKSPSKIKSLFGNGAMVEGWANYSERMMLEAGYGDNEPEMWLMWYKWSLRSVVNAILDYSIHVLGMEQEEAMNMLINEAFQEQAEADAKWRRATLSQVQLASYFNGYTEIYGFREELKQKMGDTFDLRTFHNKFLSYGNAPVPIIRKLMLEELGLN